MVMMEEEMVLLLLLELSLEGAVGIRVRGKLGLGLKARTHTHHSSLPSHSVASPSRFPPQGRLSKMRLYIAFSARLPGRPAGCWSTTETQLFCIRIFDKCP